jgi:hypothetical protein
MFEIGLKNKFTMMVDASAKVLAVKADDDNPNGQASSEETMVSEMLANQMGIRWGLPKTGDATVFQVMPARGFKAGDSWMDSTTVGNKKTKTQYTARSVDKSGIVIAYSSQAINKGTQTLMGQEADLDIKETESGTLIIDQASGILREKTATIQSSGTVTAQQMSIPVNGSKTVHITVKPS